MKRFHRLGRATISVLSAMVGLSTTANAFAQDCFSNDPADWPAPARPYFLLAVDTSGSMNSAATPNSCKEANGFSSDYPDTRIGAARCAITKTVEAFSGQVNFGLMTFAYSITGNGLDPCPDNMSSTANGCAWSNYEGNVSYSGCGPRNGDILPGAASNTYKRRRGGTILVALQQDQNPPQSPGNFGDILGWADNRCDDQCHELHGFSHIFTPLNGILRDAYRYLSRGWNAPPKSATATPYDFPTPLTGNEAGCRSVNVILLTDGAETCDSSSAAVDAAAQLWNGFNITTSGQTNAPRSATTQMTTATDV